jgi:hypothetical protein
MSKHEVETIEHLEALAGYVPEGWHEVCLDAVAIIKRRARKVAKLEAALMKRASAPDAVAI